MVLISWHDRLPVLWLGRIVTYSEEGQECFIDDHMGFIKFGSRVDLYLPLDSEILVKMGQATVGDETLIARLK